MLKELFCYRCYFFGNILALKLRFVNDDNNYMPISSYFRTGWSLYQENGIGTNSMQARPSRIS